MRIVVTGGAGALGSLVVAEGRSRGHDTASISRRNGVDLATGRGLSEALAGADVVINCASNPRKPAPVDIEGTRHLVQAIEPGTHIVQISIVGCDRNPFGYYRAKTQAEQILAESDRPVTIVRATQFHDFAATMARSLTLGPVALGVRGLACQPVETRWVASRLLDHAEEARPQGCRRATDLAGPAVFTLPEIASRLRTHAGRGVPRVLTLPPVGGVLRSFANRTNLPSGEVEIGGASFDDWLAGQ
ncbi:uncharacterized protein YbjT (DUF2867 family) [Nocardioides daedukensis]|uniref:Uncharacterized protein YbjT (DUF2867 family) n=1 Tax=Nocardioides daedukensis TaxID=634462 RepID=A0A7Y9S0P6_9ACTN|nr:NAD(P)H-binding protein [Nocardioides daedukensis]NYG59011.1 uncharacterized protein YbjT (DUF2867 family) [Nocardioides daedukensis]